MTGDRWRRDLHNPGNERRRVLAYARRLAIVLALGAGACAPARPPVDPASGATGSGGVNHARHLDAPYVILVSLDGFRPDYLERFDLPALRALAARGARARRMRPVFPTLTFPNHYSLVTGLHPERHGIVGNSFFDPARGARYSLRDADAVADHRWYRGEPIWVVAERQGMVAASYFWPGSEAAIGGVRPTYWHRYDQSVANTARVDAVLEWLRLPAGRRPHLITLYFSDVDTASHRGPLGSPEIAEAAARVDTAIARLIEGIESTPARGRTHLVITSDHGMVETSSSRRIALESVLEESGVVVGYSGAVVGLHVDGGAARARQVRDGLNARLREGRAWLRENLPKRLRFRADPRAGDVVVVMNEGWLLTPAANPGAQETMGMHGWDNALDSMQAFFLVCGPGVAPGTVADEVSNVDVHPFLAGLLGLQPARNIDGRPGAIDAAFGRPARAR